MPPGGHQSLRGLSVYGHMEMVVVVVVVNVRYNNNGRDLNGCRRRRRQRCARGNSRSMIMTSGSKFSIRQAERFLKRFRWASTSSPVHDERLTLRCAAFTENGIGGRIASAVVPRQNTSICPVAARSRIIHQRRKCLEHESRPVVGLRLRHNDRVLTFPASCAPELGLIQLAVT